jgi:Arc/MetJ-type ribon-helix-helix transcriptional regulator
MMGTGNATFGALRSVDASECQGRGGSRPILSIQAHFGAIGRLQRQVLRRTDGRLHLPETVTLLTSRRTHLYAIHTDGIRMVAIMADNVHELRPKPADTEKITINLGYVDLGHVDLMVQEGFYSNRTDFIRTAIRNQLERHADVVKRSMARKSLDLGLRNYSREDLEAARRAGEMLHINVLGLASIAQDVTPELARATISSVSVLGALHASPAVKAALADRTR